MAKAQEATGTPKSELAAAYKKAIFSQDGGLAFGWLFNALTTQEYTELVKTFCDASTDKSYFVHNIAGQFEKANQWPAFKAFAEVVFARSKDPVVDARNFASSLDKNGGWMKEYDELCRSQPGLLEYVNEKDYALAKKCIEICGRPSSFPN